MLEEDYQIKHHGLERHFFWPVLVDMDLVC